MADEIDRAQDADATNLADAMDRHRILAANVPRLQPLGHCRNPMCGEPFPANDNRLFCGRECAEEHARIAKR